MFKLSFLLLFTASLLASEVRVQVLGSGGPEFHAQRASSSYLVWVDEKAKILIDCGGGSFLRFAQSGAKIEDLDAILLTHLHIDHTADLSAFIKAGYFSDRSVPLPIFGPQGKGAFPSLDVFLERLVGESGAYAYMADTLTPQSRSFELLANVLPQEQKSTKMKAFLLRSMGVHHGIVPALAFRIEIEGKNIVFTGDTNDQEHSLAQLADNADLLIADFAIPEAADEISKKLHMQPSLIGEMAHRANVAHLLLSHIMKRSEASIDQSIAIIRGAKFDKKLSIANDLMMITP
ncbi:MAG: MBL fold metallo-hydrolase [Campylobacterales bacterium]|nr:MBL fold metallo-hydrolase [Campylobacterales bacterium]